MTESDNVVTLTFERHRRDTTRKVCAAISLGVFVGSMLALFVLAVLT